MVGKIIKNSGYILIAQVLIKVIAFFYTLYLARFLGVSDFGLYVTALSYFSLISAISDFGINRYMVREVSRDRSRSSQVLSNIVLIRMISLSTLFFIGGWIIYTFDPDKLRGFLTIMAVLAVIPQSIALTFDSLYIGLQKLYISGVALVLLSIFNVIFGVYLVGSGYGSLGAIYSLILAEIVYAIILILITLNQKISFITDINVKLIKDIIKGSLPYGLLGILGLLYFKVDTLMLSYMKGQYDTGIYGAAYKFLEAIVFVPSAVATALFPVFSKLHESNSMKIKHYYFKTVAGLGLLSLVVLLGYIFILPTLITILLPKYTESISAILILSITIPFIFMHVPGAMVLLSTDRYLKPVIFLSLFTVSFNIILNYLFIPQFGFIASSWITVASEVLTFIIFFVFLNLRVFK